MKVYRVEHPEKRAQWKALNKDKVRAAARKSHLRNKQKRNQESREYHAKNKARLKPIHAAWYMNHRDDIKAKRALEYVLKKEEVSRHQKLYYIRNKAKICLRVSKYRTANPDLIRKRDSEYKKAHPERIRATNGKRRAIKRGASVCDVRLIGEWEQSWRMKRRVRCYWCRSEFAGKICHLDHIVSFKLGGFHSIDNVCVSCPSCNLRKNSKSVAEWNSVIKEPVLI